MFGLTMEENTLPFGEREESLKYRTLIVDSKVVVIKHYIEAGMVTNNQNPSMKKKIFTPEAKNIASLLCSILGYKSDEEVYETILGFMSSLHPIRVQTQTCITPNFVADIFNQQLTEFPSQEFFSFPSYLLFLFLHQN